MELLAAMGLKFIFDFMKNHINAEEIASNLDGTFNNINNIIQGAIDLVTNPLDSMHGIWNVISNIHASILPMGYSLLTLFFLLGLINRSMSFRIIRIEDIIRLLIRLIIAKVVMENCFELLSMVYSMVTDLILNINVSIGPIKIVDTTALAEQIKEMNWIQRIIFQTQFTPISIVSFFLNLMTFIICYGRILELCVFTALSPLPIATLSSEEYASTSKRFFQHYIAICLQGLIIIIDLMIFAGLSKTLVGTATTGDFGVGMSISLSVMLIMVLSKSESWARQITGVN